MTPNKQKAVALEAAGKLTAERIGKEVGVSRRTVQEWRADKEFVAAVKEVRNAWRVKARGQGIADQDYRLRDLNDRHKRLRAVIQERAKDPQMQEVAGGKTGLLTVKYKMQSVGDGCSDAIAEYEVDTGMMAEMRAIEQQIAIELGQWKPKTVSETTVNLAITIVERLNAGRKRVADEKAKREIAAKAE